VLAYLFWHRPAIEGERDRYEQALERFHRSLAHQPPSGFHGSAAFRVPELPWLDGGEGYEDWYLVGDWAALGVLEEAVISRGHVTAHDTAAAHVGAGTAAVYRLIEGSPRLGEAEAAVWVTAALRREPAGLGALLGDGMDPARDSLWRRCLVLGPAPEYCLLVADAPSGVAPSRLPPGWSAIASARDVLWSGLGVGG
jgi:hypothetical protein